MKRILSFIILLALFLLFVFPVQAKLSGGFTDDDIVNEFNRIMRSTGYGDGDNWVGRAGFSPGEGCYGFARDVFDQVFGVTVRFSYDDGTTTSPHLYCVVSTTEPRDMDDLLKQAHAGDIFCFAGKSNRPHSMLVYSNDPENRTIDIYDNNWAGYNIVDLRKNIPYSYFIDHLADGRSSRMTLFRYTSEAPIVLDEADILLLVGENAQLHVMDPPDSFNAPTWVSSNPKVATVTSRGLVTAKGYGTATITCYAGKLTSSCEIEVMDIQINRAELISPPSSFFKTYKYPLEVIIYRTDIWPTFSGEVVWDSSDPAVCRIDNNGMVTIYKEGEAVITATFTYNGISRIRTCKVFVKNS